MGWSLWGLVESGWLGFCSWNHCALFGFNWKQELGKNSWDSGQGPGDRTALDCGFGVDGDGELVALPCCEERGKD